MSESFGHVMAPDVLLIGPEWRDRALLRAQLVEDGHQVVAIDAWPPPRVYRPPEQQPRVIVIDLRGLPDPRTTLQQLRLIYPPDRAVVITALGSLSADEVRHAGFTVIERPTTIGQIAQTVRELLEIN